MKPRPPKKQVIPKAGAEEHAPRGERLQKVLAAAGLGSRRDCEELIEQGRVEVDRQVVTELGVRVDADTQAIRVDGEPLKRKKREYYALHKPRGILCTNEDPQGRPRAVDLIPSSQRLFAVGRLDKSSEGLILITNDGELTNRLTHPRYGVAKTYLVEVAGHLEDEHIQQLRQGVHLAEAFVKASAVRRKKQLSKSTLLEIVLKEGRNREIRRLLAHVNHKVLRLTRIAVGPVKLGNLPEGAYRVLTREEVRNLREASAGTVRSPRKPRSKSFSARPGRAQAAHGSGKLRGVKKKGAVKGKIIGGGKSSQRKRRS